jgi:uncharacterized glyoxalase superfamily protein PhnB
MTNRTDHKAWPGPTYEDPAAVFARAQRLGATVLRPMEDADYGSRGFSIADAEGNTWSFGTCAGS